MNLDEKIIISRNIIKSGLALKGKQVIFNTGGKDSTVLCDLVRREDEKIKCAFIDTGYHFEETIEIINSISNIDTILVKSSVMPYDREKCCHSRKTEPMLDYLRKNTIYVAYIGVRWDEGTHRANELFFKRDVVGALRVHPILHWSLDDIWEYIKKNNLKVNKLYEQGYKSIGCKPCTKPWQGGGERSGRSQDKEKIMRRLRNTGYF